MADAHVRGDRETAGWRELESLAAHANFAPAVGANGRLGDIRGDSRSCLGRFIKNAGRGVVAPPRGTARDGVRHPVAFEAPDELNDAGFMPTGLRRTATI